jgi:hypothetical protein
VTLFITNTDDTTNTIQAVEDGMDGIEVTNSTGATNVLNVLDNDTLNNQPATPNTVTISSPNLPNGIFLNADGSIDVNENTASGNYQFEYTICEIANPNNCDTASVNINVTNVLIANDDVFDNVDGTNTTSGLFDAFGNDTLNNQEINPTWAVSITELTNSSDYFVLNTNNGTVDQVISNAPSGVYTITYQLCENFTETPNSNCSTATIQITVN